MNIVVRTGGGESLLRWFLLILAMSFCFSSKSTNCPICPANDFYLPVAEVSKMEFAALHDGNSSDAVRLANYYGIYLNKPLFGSLWNFRAAQLGDVFAVHNLCVEGLFNNKTRIFSSILSDEKGFALLSDIAQMYVCFHGISNRLDTVNLSSNDTHIVIRQLDAELAVAGIGSADAAFRRGGKTFSWPIDYVAYKVRSGDFIQSNASALEILVFPSFHGMCQGAVKMAEAKGLPLIVVAVDLKDRFGIRPKEVSQKECYRCVCKILKQVIADYSLSSDTVVRFAEDQVFAERMKIEGCAFAIKPAPLCFMRRD